MCFPLIFLFCLVLLLLFFSFFRFRYFCCTLGEIVFVCHKNSSLNSTPRHAKHPVHSRTVPVPQMLYIFVVRVGICCSVGVSHQTQISFINQLFVVYLCQPRRCEFEHRIILWANKNFRFLFSLCPEKLKSNVAAVASLLLMLLWNFHSRAKIFNITHMNGCC